jgi:hypothetical protein
MSVQPLRPAPRVPEEVAHARSSVRSAAAVPVGTLGVDDLAEAIQATAALEAQVAALHLRLVAEADRRKVAESLGATGADAWVAALTGSTRAVVAGGLWLARRLEETYDATRQAFAAGAISQAQARVVVEASDRLPEAVSQEQRAFAEAGLVAKAVGGMDPRRLRQAARRMVEASRGTSPTSTRRSCSRPRSAGPRSRRGCRSTTTATARSRAGSSFRSCTGTCCGRPSSGSRHRNDCPATGPESSPRTTPWSATRLGCRGASSSVAASPSSSNISRRRPPEASAGWVSASWSTWT